MAEVILMPKLSDTMTEGVVAEWHKKVGDEVESGELLAEIETDKATMEFESFYDGTLLHIGVEKGNAAPVNDVLAVIGEEGEDVDAAIKEATKDAAPKKEEQKEGQKEEQKEEVKEESKPKETEKPEPETSAKSENEEKSKPKEQKPSSESSSADGNRIFASPLAKKLAEEKDIDLNLVKGTGDNGRIVKRDIENYVPYERPEGGGAAPAHRAPVGEESFTEENVSQMRKTIARRLAESKFSAPHFYLTMSIDMDNAIKARKAINEEEGVKVSFNDLVVKAASMALRKHPAINSSWREDKIRRNEHIHIGIAVAVDEGLLVPVVRFADNKGLVEINSEVKDYAQKAKNKKLQPEDWEGNTFTISNLGMYGIEDFTAIINSPDSCILAVGGIQQTPVVKNGEVVPGNVMKVTLSCDHRVVDGASGSEFLNTFKSYLENPVRMLM